MVLRAGQKRIPTFDAMNNPILHQEIQCTINRDGSRPRHISGKLVYDFISAKRTMTGQQCLQDMSPDWRKSVPASLAKSFGMTKGVRGAAFVVVTRCQENLLRLR